MKNYTTATAFNEYAKVLESIQKDEFIFYDLANDIADQIFHLMEINNVNKKELSEKMGTSKSFVTQVLCGDANITLKTLSKIVAALDGVVHTCITSEKRNVKWFELIEGGKHKYVYPSSGFQAKSDLVEYKKNFHLGINKDSKVQEYA